MKKNQEFLQQWRNSNHGQISKEIMKMKDDLVRLKVSISLQKDKKTNQVKELRKKIARLETVNHEVRP